MQIRIKLILWIEYNENDKGISSILFFVHKIVEKKDYVNFNFIFI